MFSPSAKWEETPKLIIPLNNQFSICMYQGVSISVLNIALSHITSHSSPCLLLPAALLPHSSWNSRTCEGSSKLVSGPSGTDSGAAASCPPAPTLHPSPSGSTAPTSSPWATTTPTSKVQHYFDLLESMRPDPIEPLSFRRLRHHYRVGARHRRRLQRSPGAGRYSFSEATAASAAADPGGVE